MIGSRRGIVLAYAACALIWGTTWYVVRATTAPGALPLYESLAIRFTLAGLLLAPFAWRSRPAVLTRSTLLGLIAAGMINAFEYGLIYLGEQRVPGGLAAVIFAVQPLLLAVALTLGRIEKVGRSDVIGAMISIVGVAVIFIDRSALSLAQAGGVALVFGGVLTSVFISILLKRQSNAVSAVFSTAVFVSVTALCLWIPIVWRGGLSLPSPIPVAPVLGLLYLAVFGTVIAFGCWVWLIGRVNLMTSATMSFVFPLVALAVDAAFERAIRLEGRAYLGIAITLVGLAVSLWMRRAEAR